MQISDLTKQYTSTTSSAESMSGTRGVENLVSSVRNLTVGNIFEGTVNSIKGNQVLLGLSSGMELAARIEANMQLVQGQSMFFQVKSNDGATIAIRPYTVDGAGANLTLLNALKAANLPVVDKYLNMANTMMQEQMPIDKNSMGQMARILMNNPDMNVQTLVQMKKFNIPITTELAAQFENYMDDKSAVHTALDKFITELPATLSSKNMPFEQMKAFDSQLLMILADGAEGTVQNGNETLLVSTTQTEHVENSIPNVNTMSELADDTVQLPNGQQMIEGQKVIEGQQILDGQQTVDGAWTENAQAVNNSSGQGQENLQQVLAGQEKAIQNEQNTQLTQDMAAQNIVQEKVLNLLKNLFGDIGITRDDSSAAMLQKMAVHIAVGENVSQEALVQLFSSKDMQSLMKQVLEGQLFLEPKDVADSEKLKKLYDRLDAKTQSIEALLQNAGLKDTPLAQTVSEIHANVEFMNQLNEAYTYTQIPLKMNNQNASGQLYVYTNKRNLEDPERDLTAFLHLDLEHLGATDVSVRMHKREVNTKFYMDSDAAYDLVKAYMPQLEERLRAKGFNCKIEVENGGRHVNFVDDFLKKDAPSTGLLHRYSFDVRA